MFPSTMSLSTSAPGASVPRPMKRPRSALAPLSSNNPVGARSHPVCLTQHHKQGHLSMSTFKQDCLGKIVSESELSFHCTSSWSGYVCSTRKKSHLS